MKILILIPRTPFRVRDLPYDFYKTTDLAVSFTAWCRKHCAEKGKPYAAVQLGTECRCGFNFGYHGRVPNSECSLNCNDRIKPSSGNNAPKSKCGGTNRNNVYLSEAVHHPGGECWKDNENARDLYFKQKFDASMNILNAMDWCKAKCVTDTMRLTITTIFF